MSFSETEWSPNWSSDTSELDNDSNIPTLQVLPFSELFGTPEDVMETLQAFAMANGYSLAKIRTRPHNPIRLDSKVGSMVIRCSKGGKIEVSIGEERKRPSKMTECPFRLTAREDRGQWSLRLNCGDHKHGTLDFTAHSAHRKRYLTDDKVEEIKNATKCGIRPRQILNEFRAEQPGCIVQLIDIYNKKRQLRAENLKNLTPTQAIVLALEEKETWFYAIDKDSKSQQITRLFMAYLPTARELLFSNNEVVMLDCTYKTNRYKMPLLNIVGQTCLGTTFNVGTSFLSSETQNDYKWALEQGLKKLYSFLNLPCPIVWVTDREVALINAIRIIIPQSHIILCLWHINMYLRAYASKLLTEKGQVDSFMKDWEVVLYSSTNQDYVDNLSRFISRYTDDQIHNFTSSSSCEGLNHESLRANYTRILKYVQDTWIQPWRHSFIKCYTNQVLHLGNVTTQRAESAHRALKAQLGHSTGDLFSVVNSIELLLQNQLEDWRRRILMSKNVVAYEHRVPMFRKIITAAPSHSLWKVYEQYQKVLRSEKSNGIPLGICIGVFKKTMGLPCSHQIADLKKSNRILQPQDLHLYWLYPMSNIPQTPTGEKTGEKRVAAMDIQEHYPGQNPEFIESDRDEIMNIEEPAIVRGKGRPSGSRNKKKQKTFDNSTRRELSAFELTQASQPARRPNGGRLRTKHSSRGGKVRGIPENMLSAFRI